MISLHSHSGQFCKHAYGTLEDVVKSARQLGFRSYGLSEHLPRFRLKDLYPEESEMTLEDLEKQFGDYVEEARRLQSLDWIPLLVGAETEYINKESLEKTLELRKKYSLDYLVGSVHHVDEIPIDFDKEMHGKAIEHCQQLIDEGKVKDVENARELLQLRYYDAQYEMLQALKPEVVGHFDLIRLFDPTQPLTEKIWEKIKRNVDFIGKHDLLVEINSRAWKKQLPDAYPQQSILKYMMSQGIKFTLGDDCHGPKDVGMHYDKLLQYVNSVKLEKVYMLKFGRGLEEILVQDLHFSNNKTHGST